MDVLDYEDILKAVFSILAGGILGLERELKDKKAGLRTIAVICLGATLFTLLSQRMGGEENHIAAYIVGGVGFIGAGAIFREGFTISGLTTAGIVWVAAAIGMCIGFGEYYTALIFLGSCYIAVIVFPYVVNIFTPNNESNKIEVVLGVIDFHYVETFIGELNEITINSVIKAYTRNENTIEIVAESFMRNENKEKLKLFLEQNHHVKTYSISSI